MPRDGEISSAASGGSNTVGENFHLEDMLLKKRKLTNVVFQSHKGKPARSSNKALDNQLSWDEVFEDSYLTNFEMASDADLENGIEVEPVVENLFTFGN
jgi:hypothetical protein